MPGCGAEDGSRTDTKPGPDTVAPTIATATFEGTSIRLTFSEAVKSPQAVDPSKFHLTFGYYNETAVAYYYGATAPVAAHTTYTTAANLTIPLTQGAAENEIGIPLPDSFNHDTLCQNAAQLDQANPNAQAGLYLHYAEPGLPTIEDLSTNPLASIAAYWTIGDGASILPGRFADQPIPVANVCVPSGASGGTTSGR